MAASAIRYVLPVDRRGGEVRHLRLPSFMQKFRILRIYCCAGAATDICYSVFSAGRVAYFLSTALYELLFGCL